MQDEILTDLAKIADLKVISRTSVMQYKTGVARNLREIAQQLGVAHLVEGSVQRAGQSRAGECAVDRCPQRRASVGANLRSRSRGCLCHPERDRQSHRRPVAGQAFTERRRMQSSNARPQTSLHSNFTVGPRDLILNTGFSAIGAQNLREGIDLLNQALARDPSFFAALVPARLRARYTLWPRASITPRPAWL